VTLPLAAPASPVTVAVSLTPWPAVPGVGDAVSAVADGAVVTVMPVVVAEIKPLAALRV